MIMVGACATTLIALAGCSSDTSSSGAGATTSASAPSASAPAASPTVDPAAFQQVLDDTRSSFGFPGVQAGVWTADGEWIGTSGTSGEGLTTPITQSMHTRIGSITKTFTVTALLQLAEQGKLSLDDSIGTYVPGVPNADSATLANLADMTSGIPSYTLNETFTNAYFADPTQVWTPEQLIDVIRDEPASFEPGTKFDYSNSNTVLLGMVIEKVTGKSMADVFNEQIIGPLGLSGTSFPGTSAELPSPYLSGITEQGQPDGATADATNWNPSWGFTAGEMISTLDDLRTWGQALATGEGILGKEMAAKRLESLTTSVPPNTPEKSYGLGFGQLNGWIGHTGELPGYNTAVYHNTNLDTTIVVMVNSDIASPDGKNPAPEVVMGLMAVVDGSAPPQAPSGAASSSASATN
jgi:D-alanyl-D-alanine carboxypeptidase